MGQFKSGFINLLGFPNVGKSTLMNRLVGERISIVTPKVQTTRQRIIGVVTTKGFQMVFSDTPGILEPKYELQQAMINDIEMAFEDADIILYLVEATDPVQKHEEIIEKIKKQDAKYFVMINKIDLVDQQKLENCMEAWEKLVPIDLLIPFSALHNFNITNILSLLRENLPEHEAYFPEDTLTDKTERFITGEIIREKIFIHFKEEIPYYSEVLINSFKETDEILRIQADIIVGRKSHKPILIGKNGLALKRLGTDARQELEKFFQKKIYLELYVKVKENWRNKKDFLKYHGYNV